MFEGFFLMMFIVIGIVFLVLSIVVAIGIFLLIKHYAKRKGLSFNKKYVERISIVLALILVFLLFRTAYHWDAPKEYKDKEKFEETMRSFYQVKSAKLLGNGNIELTYTVPRKGMYIVYVTAIGSNGDELIETDLSYNFSPDFLEEEFRRNLHEIEDELFQPSEIFFNGFSGYIQMEKGDNVYVIKPNPEFQRDRFNSINLIVRIRPDPSESKYVYIHSPIGGYSSKVYYTESQRYYSPAFERNLACNWDLIEKQSCDELEILSIPLN